jgi:hypothetical protein
VYPGTRNIGGVVKLDLGNLGDGLGDFGGLLRCILDNRGVLELDVDVIVILGLFDGNGKVHLVGFRLSFFGSNLRLGLHAQLRLILGLGFYSMVSIDNKSLCKSKHTFILKLNIMLSLVVSGLNIGLGVDLSLSNLDILSIGLGVDPAARSISSASGLASAETSDSVCITNWG